LNRLLQRLRQRSGCLFFERRFDGPALKALMSQPAVVLGLLSDQAGGQNGLRLPFLGHECWTSPAPAVFALRYDCGLLMGICYRIGLARWRIEASQEIPTRQNGEARSLAAIMADVNRAFEAAVRRDPANWFWVHNRWKSRGDRTKGEGPRAKGIQNPKSEGRNPKEIRNPKAEIRFVRPSADFGFRISGFLRISGLRISDFALRLARLGSP
jgi:lauroyl/myristoyl acyltransferase